MNKVYLVGAGPGSPGLITVKGLEILQQADCVIYDYLVDKRLLEGIREGAELICCDRPSPCTQGLGKLGKKRYRDGFSHSQSKVNALIVKKAKEGKRVVRLKNGDPSIFGRTSQELEALVKNKIEFEIVPGVTAASAASAFSGIPLTDRKLSSSCVFVTGHEDPTKEVTAIDWDALAKVGTIVLYMAVEHLSEIIDRLIEAGKDENTPIAIIQDAGLVKQKTIKGILKNIIKKMKAEKISPPAIAIVGDVVKLGEKLKMGCSKYKRVLFTGLSEERFFTDGAHFHLPLIRIEPMEDYKEFDNYLKDIKRFDWIVFSSRYGVEYFFKRLKKVGYDTRTLGGIKIAAIGNSTANRLSDFGVLADLIPKEESSQGLVEEFKRIDLKGKKIFLPRSDIADKGLEEAFKKREAFVTTSYAYRNLMTKELPDLDLKSFDEIMFTSPSTVRSYKKRYRYIPKGVKIRSIGEVTKREVNRYLR